MIKSMTGFAVAEETSGDITVSTEIRAYNSRHLDLVLKLPQAFFELEEKVKSLIAGQVARGRLEVKIQINDTSEEAAAFEIDKPRANSLHQALLEVCETFDLPRDISLELLMSMGGLLKPVATKKDIEQYWRIVQKCTSQALSILDQMRQKEGDYTARDLTNRLDFISASIDRIATDSADLLGHYSERLQERIAALTRGTVELDPQRIAQEAAFLADRSDISEEIVRAKSHVHQFRDFMQSDDPAGRKLNFLLQELNREFNTMGSKIGNADVAHVVVDVKAELEKLREQVQNIE